MQTRHFFALSLLAGGAFTLHCGDDTEPAATDPCEALADTCLDCMDMDIATACSDVAEANDRDDCTEGLETFEPDCDPCDDLEALCPNCAETADENACEAVARADDHDDCEDALPDYQELCPPAAE